MNCKIKRNLELPNIGLQFTVSFRCFIHLTNYSSNLLTSRKNLRKNRRHTFSSVHRSNLLLIRTLVDRTRPSWSLQEDFLRTKPDPLSHKKSSSKAPREDFLKNPLLVAQS